MDKHSDNELMRLVAVKDTRAFSIIFNRYETNIFNFILRYTGNKEIAQDLLQETFIRVWYAAHTYDQKRGIFKGWVFKIALNIAKDEMKKKRYGYQYIELNDISSIKLELAHPNGESPDILAEESDTKNIIMLALEKLQPYLREVVILKHYHQFKFREIAQITNTPEGTLKARFNKAVAQLRVILKNFKV